MRMTELQASLIAIGAVIVVGVIAYNKWTEWRAKNSVENAFSDMPDDVLMGGGKAHHSQPHSSPHSSHDDAAHEHSDDEHDHSAHDEHYQHQQQHEHGHADHVEQDDHQHVTTQTAHAAQAEPLEFLQTSVKTSPLDPVVDCIIPLALEHPLRGEKIIAAFQSLRFVGNKLVQVIGETETGSLEPVAHGGAYHSLQVGVQMASRLSPLSELEYSELVLGLNNMGDELGSMPDIPDMSQVISDARRLHQFIQEFDVQLSVNVRSKGMPWLVATMRPALQRQGLDLRPDGRLIMSDGDGGLLFSISMNATPADDSTKMMTLLLPVPMVESQRLAFEAMTAFAKSLASRLSGEVIDDSGQPLNDASLDAIAAQVKDFYHAMEDYGVTAGSSAAKRLFG
jgi:FtsZ-interacting cell division protein ZipA